MPDAQPSVVSGVFRKPFAEQVSFFRNKLANLVPTARWDDITKGAHDRAFMVAGAAKADLLSDLAAAVDRSISEGKSLDAFRKDFRGIVERRGWHGWTGEGTAAGRAWRTRVIYTTNASTSYSAGRLAQLNEGGFDLWVYHHNDSVLQPRKQHLAWDGLTLPKDDPFWQTHYPPNGWGCQCYVTGARSNKGAQRQGGDPDKALPEGWDAIDEKTGEPVGIDKGWGYQPGASVTQTVQAMAQKTNQWEYTLAKAYMQGVPESVRDPLARSYRALPSVANDTRLYAQRILEGRSYLHTPPYRTLGLVTRDEATTVARLIDGDAEALHAYDWALDSYTVRKVFKDHGNDVIESARGQVAVTADDYALLPRLIADADDMEYAGRSDVGRDVVRLRKHIDGIEYVAAFEIRSGRKMLALQSWWKLLRPSPRLRP